MTDAEFWMAVRQALLGFVDAIELHKVQDQIKVRTSKTRALLRSYQLTYPFPPVAAEQAQERIEVLTTEPECGKL